MEVLLRSRNSDIERVGGDSAERTLITLRVSLEPEVWFRIPNFSPPSKTRHLGETHHKTDRHPNSARRRGSALEAGGTRRSLNEILADTLSYLLSISLGVSEISK